jgi:hypothetical protein
MASYEKFSSRELHAVRSVMCSQCGAKPGKACTVILRDFRVTRRPMVNVHPARIALARFLDKIR